jgi:hypothetical protein
VLRPTDLPTIRRCPRATVRRAADRIELRFLGPDWPGVGRRPRLARLGDGTEAAELPLLAELGARGYAVERLAPEDL